MQDLAHISKAVIEAVYKHWCKKREKAKQPLLQRLWFEQPWVRARDAGKEALPGVHKSNDSELPFMGQDAPRPPTTRPRRMNAEEALFKLESIRCGTPASEPQIFCMQQQRVSHVLCHTDRQSSFLTTLRTSVD